MTVIRVFLEGLGRMLRAPGLVSVLWAANLVLAAPLAVFMMAAIHGFTADSDSHRALMEGFDTGWYAEFSTSGSLEETFSPSHIGVGAWLDNLDRWWDGQIFLEHPLILATGAVFVLFWLLVLGGVLEAMREGAPRPRLSTVVADGVEFFPRLLRISVVTAVGYYSVFRLARWFFPKIHDFTKDMTTETEVLFFNLAGALVVVLLVAAVRLVSDYAKIAVILERRKSALVALAKGLRFVASNPLRTLALAFCYAGSLAVVFGLYSVAAPGAGDSTPLAILFAFGVSQLFMWVKHALRVGLLASEVAFFELEG